MENVEVKSKAKLKSVEDSAIKNIFKGTTIAMIITIVALFILSSILTFTNTNENVMNPSIIVISGISILIGSIIGTAKISKRGLINGAVVGGLYMVLIYLVSSTLNRDFALTTDSIILIVVGIVCGILGGIIGVNRNSRKK